MKNTLLMKYIILFSMVVGFLIACNQEDKNQSQNNVKDSIHQTDHPENALIITLNNGAKWQADASTNANVANLQSIAAKYNIEGADAKMFQLAAAELQAGLTTLVSECKMKGPDHDALHLWLEPLMKMIKDFEKKAISNDASFLLKKIDDHLKIYPEYFR